MNEHEKLEEALDLLEIYAHRNGANRYGAGKVWLQAYATDVQAGELLAKCGRFRITERPLQGGIVGYWRDEDPKRKAT